MSRDTILDDAISKAKVDEDWQLVEWLRMARGATSAAMWYSNKLCEAHRTVQKLLNENAKLRELVRDMWEFGFGDNSGANDAWAWHERADELADRMRELGVEVES